MAAMLEYHACPMSLARLLRSSAKEPVIYLQSLVFTHSCRICVGIGRPLTFLRDSPLLRFFLYLARMQWAVRFSFFMIYILRGLVFR